MDFYVKHVLHKEQIYLIHRLSSKRRVHFLSTQSLDLSSGGNYVQDEVDIPAERQNDSGKLFQRKQVVTIFINSSSLPDLIPQPSSLKISMQILSCCHHSTDFSINWFQSPHVQGFFVSNFCCVKDWQSNINRFHNSHCSHQNTKTTFSSRVL